MLRVRVECEGISPLLMNPVTDDLLEELRTGIRKPRVRDITAEEEARRKVYQENGQVGIPALNLFSCLVEAGRHVKADGTKKQVSTADSTQLPAFLSIEGSFLPLNHGAQWRVDKRPGRNPKDNAMVCVVRPRFDQWSFVATLLIDEKQIAEARVQQLFEAAGSRVGLGDFRPARRGLFGRFKVTKWEKADAGI